MNIEMREEPMSALAEHAKVSIAFDVNSVLEVTATSDGITLAERPVSPPWVKDYDAIEGEGPTRWADRFDVSSWGLISAHGGAVRLGGTVIAFNTAGVNMLEGRSDLAVMWDIRVVPQWRGRGVGRLLFQAAERWATSRGCTQLKIETQNINVDACRFYATQGCELGAIDRFAYPDLPGETQLLWYKSL